MDDAHEQERPADDDELDSVERELKQMLEASDLGGEPKDPAPMLGETIAGTYTVTDPLGEGGMGTVFLAEHARTGGKVAIKLIKASRLGDDNAIRRFELEAKHTASLHHPNIVRVFDYGRDDDLVYLAMEYVPGTSVQELIEERGALDWPLAVEIATQVLKALAAAHDSDQQIIHRDIKPANILVTDEHDETFVKVLDFGIARALEGPSANTQGVIGSPQSMAPEQFDGGPLSPATDLYALGCTMYAMLSGRPPFTGTFSQLALKHCNEEPPALSSLVAGDVPQSLVEWTNHLMQKEPGRRPPDALDALRSLRALDSSRNVPTGGRRKNPAVLVAGGVLLVGVLTSWMIVSSNDSNGATVSTTPEATQTDAGTDVSEQATASAKRMDVQTHELEDVNLDSAGWQDVSRHGNFFAYTNATRAPGTIQVRNLSTDETSAIEVPEGRKPGWFSWFPDGTRLLVTLRSDKQPELWSVDLLERNWERIAADARNGHASQDGKRIAFTAGRHSLYVSNADGTDARVVKTFSSTTFLASPLQWMDRGTLLVGLGKYTGKKADASLGRIVALEIDSGETTQLLADHRLLIPGGTRFAVVGDQLLYVWKPKSGHPQLRAVDFDAKTLKVTGRPRILLDSSGSRVSYDALSATDDGRLFVAEAREQRRGLIAEVKRNPLSLGDIRERPVGALRWLPDGSYMLSTPLEGVLVLSVEAYESGTKFTIFDPASRTREVVHQTERQQPLLGIGADDSVWVYDRTEPEKPTIRWFSNMREMSAGSRVVTKLQPGLRWPRLNCIGGSPRQCYRIQQNPGRIEVTPFSREGSAEKPSVSIPGANPPTGFLGFDIEPGTRRLLVNKHDTVEIYGWDGTLEQTWRPEGYEMHANATQWDPHGGFFLSAVVVDGQPERHLLHVAPDGAVTRLRSTDGANLVLTGVSPTGQHLALMTQSWSATALWLKLE